MKPVSSYLDFRSYLGDWIAERKKQGMPGSNRWFAQKIGINSTSWLTSVLKGAKGLSKSTANKLSRILKHSSLEARYFETLVAFNQAKTLEERNEYYLELAALRKLRTPKAVVPGQYEYYSTWYHSVVRSIVGMHEFTEHDHERIASMVVPTISPRQVRRSLELLEKVGLVCRDEHGVYRLESTAISTGVHEHSLAVANYQQETMRLAQEALDRVPASERDISTLTVGVSQKGLKAIASVLADTRRRIAELANSDDSADRVLQINMQVFPLSKPAQRKDLAS